MPILLTVLFFAVIWGVVGLIGNWRSLKINDRVRIRIEIAAIGAAALSVIFSVNTGKKMDFCAYRQNLSNEIVHLVNSTAHDVQYELNIPHICYDNRSGDDIDIPSPLRDSFERFRSETSLLKIIVKMLPLRKNDGDVLDRYLQYAKAVVKFQNHCKQKPDYSQAAFLADRKDVDETAEEFALEVAQINASCFK